uniref:uncharacterized protein LOC117610568 n=1 Tax=Osmia lignaria TaxID=473952 RepID=UPI0014782CBF|nr:uncharacterized protein LOC117610568 [Osmia lignaria]
MAVLEGRRRNGEMGYETFEEADVQLQERERWQKIRDSKYNKWYKVIKKPGTPRYLEEGRKQKRWRRIARFRLGNEVNKAKYWEKEEKRRCRVCGWERETWEHVWKGCRRNEEMSEGWQEKVEELLGEEQEGETWMKKIKGRRAEDVEVEEGTRS